MHTAAAVAEATFDQRKTVKEERKAAADPEAETGTKPAKKPKKKRKVSDADLPSNAGAIRETTEGAPGENAGRAAAGSTEAAPPTAQKQKKRKAAAAPAQSASNTTAAQSAKPIGVTAATEKPKKAKSAKKQKKRKAPPEAAADESREAPMQSHKTTAAGAADPVQATSAAGRPRESAAGNAVAQRAVTVNINAAKAESQLGELQKEGKQKKEKRTKAEKKAAKANKPASQAPEDQCAEGQVGGTHPRASAEVRVQVRLEPCRFLDLKSHWSSTQDWASET